MQEFQIKHYSKKELALLFFPHSTPRTAVKHLMAWIAQCAPLWQRLCSAGYKPSSKGFTPRQVKDIVEHLGEP